MPRSRLESWELRTEWPLTAAAAVFFIAYAWEVLGQLSGRAHRLAEAIIWATWVIFAGDYLTRLALTERRTRWFFRHLPDLAVVALPVLRPLRLIRLVNFLVVLSRSAGNALRGRVVVYAVSGTGVLILASSLAILDAERDAPGSTVTSFGKALWWSITTVTTVGYGDTYPVTTTGRIIAAGLIIAGIGVLGTVTATLASWLVEQVSIQDEQAQAATRAQVEELGGQIARLQATLDKLDPARRTDDQMKNFRRSQQISFNLIDA